MLKKLFGKKERTKPTEEQIYSPLTGTLIPIEEVPDPTFSEKMMGDGFAVAPTEGKVVAPVDGDVIQVFPTKHAIGMKTAGDLEILIHIGLDTVNLGGEGFITHVKEGDHVKRGDVLVEFDIDVIKKKATSSITPVVVTNVEKIAQMSKESHIDVIGGETEVLTVSIETS
ncbi:PTS sugar transporter subunit IIA [Halalkalibacter hemicellulosilyticus]|uniref:PTS system n=1 Tax=Halalkalibacter hemicellulosilyticusJCM 9152 TaxID=1236971 RepID=W4QI13_9BACI|nr:PTS glucose transporter subunit IIA [Halalkalibacter hemicellulosilyticus]GAE30949.1 PTS system [Halalkalibacter hemicellulosilyticusJCM 9152]